MQQEIDRFVQDLVENGQLKITRKETAYTTIGIIAIVIAFILILTASIIRMMYLINYGLFFILGLIGFVIFIIGFCFVGNVCLSIHKERATKANEFVATNRANMLWRIPGWDL